MVVLKKIQNLLLQEAHNWVLWLPVFFACGVIFYFQLNYEPSRWQAVRFVTLPVILMVLLRHKFIWRSICIVLLFIGLGFLLAKFQADQAKTRFVDTAGMPITLSGKVLAIDYKDDFPKLTLGNLRIDGFSYVPDKIKLNIRTRVKGKLEVGSRIITDAVLMRPPGAVIRGGYDYAKIAYFEGIGATGYSVKTLVILKAPESADIRSAITRKVYEALEGDEAAISSALINGDMGLISQGAKNDFRASGLAHILSISGLHLVIVTGVFFFTARFLFSLFYSFSETHNIKKYAAVIALVGGLGYLLISGMQVPAVRAFIMVMLIMLAIIFDRTVTPLRSVCFAALIIMMFEPTAVISPSFQMSFAAAAALIAFYELSLKTMPWFYRYKIVAWALGSVLTSLIAGFATAPFAAYHFGRFTNYSLLANFAASPVTTFIIMPMATLGTLLMPLGLHEWPLKIMGLGVGVIIDIAEYIAYLPGAYVNIPQITPFGFALMIFGFLWAVLWKLNWRYLGFAFMLAGFLTAYITPRPDMLVSETGKLYAINNNGRLEFSSTREGFVAKSWTQYFGQEDIYPLTTHRVKGCHVGKSMALCDGKKLYIPRNSMVYLPDEVVDINTSRNRPWQ